MGLVQFKDSMQGRNAHPIPHLALYVAGRENTDTILTIPSLKQLFGSVFHAIETSTAVSERNDEQDKAERSRRFWYGSKADQDSRLGVNPSNRQAARPDAMAGAACDARRRNGARSFAGTGTTGEAALREGMRAVLIEAEPEYQADIRRRMALVLAGPDERTAKASGPRACRSIMAHYSNGGSTRRARNEFNLICLAAMKRATRRSSGSRMAHPITSPAGWCSLLG